MRARRQAAFTLIELMVVVAIIGAMAALAVTGFDRWQRNQLVQTTARSVGDALTFARGEAIRTGSVIVVFLSAAGGTDAIGNPLVDSVGNPVPLLILNDGAAGTAGQNCIIDPGEDTQTIPLVQGGVGWGFAASGGLKAPNDNTGIATATGASFATPAGNPATWVAFRPDGVPVGFDAACNLGDLGSGNGGVYLTNGTRDYAVVVQPLGDVRVHGWDLDSGAWRN